MTNPREHSAAGTAAAAHTEPEAIDDLDVTGDDADAVGGGFNYAQPEVKYVPQKSDGSL